MKTKTKIKISGKTVFVVISAVIIITTLFVVLSMLPTIPGQYASDSVKNTSGWCVTEIGLVGKNGIHTTRTNCISRQNDNSNTTNWYAFCPDIAGQGERNQSNCDCTYSDIIKSEALGVIISDREALIEDLNDGEFSLTGLAREWAFMTATSLHCACPIFKVGEPSDPDDFKTVTWLGGEITGVYSFVSKIAKMFSKMYSDPPECTPVLPEGCYIGESYDKYRDNEQSPHRTGQALDISCNESIASACGTKTAELLEKVRAAASGLNIIRECTPGDKQNGGVVCKTDNTQTIHVDEKIRTSGSRTDDPDIKECLYINCDFNECNPM